MKVLLLVGGWSPEREVSLRGGEQIAATLRERGHYVTLFDPAQDFDRLMEAGRQHDVALSICTVRREKTGLFRLCLIG